MVSALLRRLFSCLLLHCQLIKPRADRSFRSALFVVDGDEPPQCIGALLPPDFWSSFGIQKFSYQFSVIPSRRPPHSPVSLSAGGAMMMMESTDCTGFTD